MSIEIIYLIYIIPMINNDKIPQVVKLLNLSNIKRIDYSMEGDWNANIVVIWERKKGVLDYSGITRSHYIHKPTIELYFENHWVGLHCYKNVEGNNLFDEDYALLIIKYIETQI